MDRMLKLMVAEEEEALRLLFSEVMKEECGHEVMMIGHGSALLEKISEYEPDILVLDLKFGDYWGISLMEEILAKVPDLPVIIWTGYDTDYQREAMLKGAAGYVVKSSEMAEMKDAIREVAETRLIWL